MVNLIFFPVKNQVKGSTCLVYDDACSSGGMLTESEAFLRLSQVQQVF
jgi:type I restriction enzyme M protein